MTEAKKLITSEILISWEWFPAWTKTNVLTYWLGQQRSLQFQFGVLYSLFLLGITIGVFNTPFRCMCGNSLVHYSEDQFFWFLVRTYGWWFMLSFVAVCSWRLKYFRLLVWPCSLIALIIAKLGFCIFLLGVIVHICFSTLKTVGYFFVNKFLNPKSPK